MKNIRRVLRPAGKTIQAAWRWKRFSFNDAPPIFGNSKPKSGSHLLLQILSGFTQIMPYRYVDAEPIGRLKRGKKKDEREILGKTMHGVIGWGYLEAKKENASL